MADNALTMFAPGNLPAHVAAMFGDVPSNLPEKQNVPSLSYTGKVWSIHLDGTKNTLTYRNEDGDDVPVAVMRVVVLNANARRGRAFYEGTYDPDKVTAPKCWSDDGVAPAKAVKEPCAATCANCPQSVKGSKIDDNGKAGVACAQHRMLVVVPSGKLDFTPLRLKIAITSDWDSQSPEQEAQGWFSWSRYCDFLKSRGLPHTAAIVTKIKFDQSTAYPKLFFSADRWLNDEEAKVVRPRIQSDEVLKLLDGSFTPAGVDGVATDGDGGTQVIAPAAKPEPEVAIKPAAQAEPEPEINFGQVMGADEPQPETKPAKPKAEEAPQATANVPEELASLMAAWTKG